MAEAIVSVIAEGILTKLGSAVLNEIGLLGVNDEFENLKNTVDLVQAVLLDAEQKYSTNNQVEVWLRQLKQVFTEADDLLDDISTEALRRKLMPRNKISKKIRTFFSKGSNQTVQMAHRVRNITQKLNKIAENRRFLLEDRPPENSVVNSGRETHSSPPPEVVGREDDKRVIIEHLLSADCKDGVGYIAIVGIGGLGKTTLAQSVFNDEKVKESFEPKLWVCVSDDFDLKVIIGSILGRERSENMDLNTLKDDLLKKINGKRYLLVLDDVWSENQGEWSGLTDLLVGGSSGSRVIVTTRSKKVTRMTRPILSHEVKGLSEMDSWSLLKQMAFSKDQVCSDDYEKIGKEILKKCCGVPLAIRAIGGLLYHKQSVAEWRVFEDKEIMKIDEKEDSILPVLEISYNHLPPHLKNCFVYCRLFPKDWRIDVHKLINYWIAQGFVKASDATQCPMDVGLEYFEELSWRSFFQEVEKDDWGNVSCKMHDLIHDLTTKLAGVESVVVDSVGNNCVDGRTLHASFLRFDDPDKPWELPASLLKAGNLRTFLLLHGNEGAQWDVTISNFRRLRILELDHLKIPKIMHSINKLKYLRHLDLSYNTKIEVLSNSITTLYNLLTLILDNCSKLKQLPKYTQNLTNLSQLSLEGCSGLTHMPQGIGKLTSLCKLSIFVVAKNKHAGTLKELGRLNNLRGKLEIINLGDVRKATEFQEANLKEKLHLQELKLDWTYYDLEDVDEALEALQPHLNLKVLTVSDYIGSKIPRWLTSLVNLVELRLDGCFKCRHLPPMHQLCNLKGLYISDFWSLEYIDNETTTESAIGGREESTSTTSTSSFFPSLETLELSFCRQLKGWWRTTPTQPPRFPCLSKLTIHECPQMTSMPTVSNS